MQKTAAVFERGKRMIEIHIDPQFEGLRREMKRYPREVITKANVRTLNKMATKGASVARKGIAKHYGVPQKNIKKRIKIEKANTRKQHAKIMLIQSRTSSAAGRGEMLVTAGTMLKHLSVEAMQRRINRDERFQGKANRAFVASPRGYPMVFARTGNARYPLETVRVSLRQPWNAARSQMKSTVRANYAKEWEKNARFYKGRMKKKHTY